MKKLFSISIIVLFLFSLVSFNASAASWVTQIPNATLVQNSGTVLYDSDLSAPGTGTNAGDADPQQGGSLEFSITKQGTGVTCSLSGTNNEILSLTPNASFTGSTSCIVQAVDQFSADWSEFTITVTSSISTLEVTGDTLSNNLLVIPTPKDYDDNIFLTFKNTGTSTLTFPANAVTTFGTFADEDGDPIQITFSNVPSTLAPSATQVVTLSFTVDKDVGVDSYPTNGDGKLKIATTQFTKEINLRVDVTPEDVCEDGRRFDGDRIPSSSEGLRVKDFNADPDNNFGPGEIIEITNVEISNEGNVDVSDVIVEAILYNLDQDEIIVRAESDPEDVDEDDSVDFNDFELEVPVDDNNLDENDIYILYIIAKEDGNEDENCNYDDSTDDMEFKRENNDVRIIKATVTPASLACNANANFVIDVRNVGDDNDDRVSVKLRDAELELDWESELFSLDQFDDNDDSATITYTYRIPSNTVSGSYNVEAIVVFDGGRNTDSEFVTLQVQCGGSQTGEGNVRVSLVQSTVTASAGKLFGLPFKLANLEDSVQTYTVSLNINGNWATAPQDEQVTLQPRQETTLYSYLTPNSNLNAGSYTVDISVEQNGNVVATQTATVQISGDGGSVTGGSTFEPTVSFDSVWRNLAGSSTFWIVLVIVLFVIVVYVLTILLRPR